MGADKNSIGGNGNIWCNECGDPRHPQKICPNEIYCEDFSAKTIECRNLQVKENDMERILFKINGLPKQTFSVRIKALKTPDKIQVLEKRELVLQKTKIQVDFKFLEPMRLNTKDLNNLFVCEIFHKLNDPVSEISQPPKHEESSNFQTYVSAVKEKKIPWDIFSTLVKDLSKSLQDTKTLNELLLKEWKNSIDHEAELEAELEESRKIVEKFHQATKKINQLVQPQVTTKRLQNDDDNDIKKYQPEIKKPKNVYSIQSVVSSHKNYHEKEIENDKTLESEEILPNDLENDINLSGDSDNENDNDEGEKDNDKNVEPEEKFSNYLENGTNLLGHSDNENGHVDDHENGHVDDNESENDNKNADNHQDERVTHSDKSSNVHQYHNRKSNTKKDKHFECDNESQNNSKSFKCHGCSKRFTQKGTMKRHMIDKHPNGNESENDKKTQSDNSSNVHQYHNRKSNTKKDRPFECDNDSKNNSKRFKCHVCSKGFTQKGTMKRHTRTIHPNAVQPPIHRRRRSLDNYKCNNCTKTFRSSRYYNLHVHSGRCDIHIVKLRLRKEQRTLKLSKKLKKSKN